jgi:hypothetical protein
MDEPSRRTSVDLSGGCLDSNQNAPTSSDVWRHSWTSSTSDAVVHRPGAKRPHSASGQFSGSMKISALVQEANHVSGLTPVRPIWPPGHRCRCYTRLYSLQSTPRTHIIFDGPMYPWTRESEEGVLEGPTVSSYFLMVMVRNSRDGFKMIDNSMSAEDSRC